MGATNSSDGEQKTCPGVAKHGPRPNNLQTTGKIGESKEGLQPPSGASAADNRTRKIKPPFPPSLIHCVIQLGVGISQVKGVWPENRERAAFTVIVTIAPLDASECTSLQSRPPL